METVNAENLPARMRAVLLEMSCRLCGIEETLRGGRRCTSDVHPEVRQLQHAVDGGTRRPRIRMNQVPPPEIEEVLPPVDICIDQIAVSYPRSHGQFIEVAQA